MLRHALRPSRQDMREYRRCCGRCCTRARSPSTASSTRSARRWARRAPPRTPVLVAALAPVMLKAAGRGRGHDHVMANAKAIESHVLAPDPSGRHRRRARRPRIVVGLPVAVCDDEAEAADAAKQFAVYGHAAQLPAVLAHGGCEGPGDAAIIGDEARCGRSCRPCSRPAAPTWGRIFPVGATVGRREPAPAPCCRSWSRPSGCRRSTMASMYALGMKPGMTAERWPLRPHDVGEVGDLAPHAMRLGAPTRRTRR